MSHSGGCNARMMTKRLKEGGLFNHFLFSFLFSLFPFFLFFFCHPNIKIRSFDFLPLVLGSSLGTLPSRVPDTKQVFPEGLGLSGASQVEMVWRCGCGCGRGAAWSLAQGSPRRRWFCCRRSAGAACAHGSLPLLRFSFLASVSLFRCFNGRI